LAEFCRRHRIRKLAFFGSVLRDDFGPASDVDVLVEFESGARVGLIRLAGIENELSELLGRKVDLNTPGCLSPYFRDEVLREAEVVHEQA
jgi:predicted nucleotidyltransferase